MDIAVALEAGTLVVVHQVSVAAALSHGCDDYDVRSPQTTLFELVR